jgi:general L-amino acid transport system permease protein
MYVKTTRTPDLPPPPSRRGLFGWLRANLFSSPLNSVLTLLGVTLLYVTIPPVLNWAVFNANWAGTTRESCALSEATGACWVFIKVRLGMLMYGFYPQPERWRIDLAMLILAFLLLPIGVSNLAPRRPRLCRGTALASSTVGTVLIAALVGPWAALLGAFFFLLPFGRARLRIADMLGSMSHAPSRWLLKAGSVVAVGAGGMLLARSYVPEAAVSLPLALVTLSLLVLNFKDGTVTGWMFRLLTALYPFAAWWLFLGGPFGLEVVSTDMWGGLFLTLVIACIGMATSLPIGIVLALGRRSTMPVIRSASIAYIEFVRGVPLISVLFMVSVMLPLTLPEGVHFNKLLRALVGVSLFYAAYMAEVVRGGLQAIPSGQYEAAQALGLRYWKTMRLIILPQALRLVIPGITNTFLGLFKDTTLVAVINLMDILGIVKSALADSQWLGFTKEAYIFAGLTFWVLCFGISRYSMRLEKTLNTETQS